MLYWVLTCFTCCLLYSLLQAKKWAPPVGYAPKPREKGEEVEHKEHKEQEVGYAVYLLY